VCPSLAPISNPCNHISSCVIPELKPSGSHFKIEVVLKGRNRRASVAAMVDCGATALFISERFVKRNKVCTHPLAQKIALCNIDGSRNRAGNVALMAHLRLQIGDVEEWCDFLVTDLGPEDVVLGLPWLRSVNPEIDWAEGTMKMEKIRRREVELVAASRGQR
jgi:predicted aspartyl protease